MTILMSASVTPTSYFDF